MKGLDQLVRDLRKLEKDLVAGVRRAEWKSARQGVRLAKILSSGTITPAMSRKLDYIYAKRHSRPLANPGLINKQSGTFADDWIIVPLPALLSLRQGGPASPMIRNTAPYAHWLQTGTKRMWNRPIDETLLAALEPIRIRNLDIEMKALESKIG